jgi:adenylate cyclase
MHYKGTKKTLAEIARELNVDAVVEGTVQRSGNRVLVSAQLIHAPTDRHLWAESYDRDLRDVLALESEVALAIATEIKAQVSPQEHLRLTSARPINPEAHELCLKGVYYLNKETPEALKKSLECFQEATEKDAKYALAYAGLADCYEVMGGLRALARDDAFPKAEAAARHALQLDETLAEAHVAFGAARWIFDWDWYGAEKEYKRAIELNPGNPDAHDEYSVLLTAMGRHQEAIVEVKKAVMLDPVTIHIVAEVGWVLYYARLYDQAIAAELKTLEMDPNFAIAHSILGDIYTQKGLYKEALVEYQRWAGLSSVGPGTETSMAYTYARMGRTAEALQKLNKLKSEFHHGHLLVTASDIALLYAALGDKNQAFAWLEKSFGRHEELMAFLKVEPTFDPLRSDPRFQDLVRRMHFPE